jgi:hypothetical protein
MRGDALKNKGRIDHPTRSNAYADSVLGCSLISSKGVAQKSSTATKTQNTGYNMIRCASEFAV